MERECGLHQESLIRQYICVIFPYSYSIAAPGILPLAAGCGSLETSADLLQRMQLGSMRRGLPHEAAAGFFPSAAGVLFFRLVQSSGIGVHLFKPDTPVTFRIFPGSDRCLV
ncbi:MAG: hypothetical protein KDA79_13895 [Planctomycetaceae bacterium]|nr:hypothetical protein [Planctomycetaceae bacterium]